MSTFKAVLLGEGRVGKTSIGMKWCQNSFDPQRPSTVKAGYYAKKLDTSSGLIELRLWDTAGQEEYHAVAPIYYKGAQAALLVYSVVDDGSFDRMRQWHQELRQILGAAVIIVVVANKVDLAGRVISATKGVEYANSIGCTHFEVSAKTGQGLDMLFKYLGEELAKSVRRSAAAPGTDVAMQRRKNRVQIIGDEEKPEAEANGCCS
jgi:small GTP-binding protein